MKFSKGFDTEEIDSLVFQRSFQGLPLIIIHIYIIHSKKKKERKGNVVIKAKI